MIEALRKKGGPSAGRRRRRLPPDPAKIDEFVGSLRKEMKKAARELRFEEAAKLRDEIRELSGARLAI